MDPRISVVIATRDRRERLGPTLDHLQALPESPRVILVDNGSRDGTADFVRASYPEVRLIPVGKNLGAAARNVGVREASSPHVAFSDDDSWWASGSLTRAADRLDNHPTLALVAACVRVEPSGRIDPTCLEMASSPLPSQEALPGPPVLGFLACGAVVRRSAFLEAGGFEARFGIGGEEELLAIDLAASGWDLAYCEDVVAYHHPVASGPRPGRRRVQYRNALWSAWLRRPLSTAMLGTVHLAAAGYRDPDARAALRDALAGLPWALRCRRPVPPEVERALVMLGR